MGCFTEHLTFFLLYCYKYLQHVLRYQRREEKETLISTATFPGEFTRAFHIIFLHAFSRVTFLFNLDIKLFNHKVNCLLL